MWRAIGSMTVLALVMAGCGGGSSSGPSAAPTGYTVGGVVAGLAGKGLLLQLNGGGDLAVTANGAFTFTSKVLSGLAYTVTVKTQPTAPTQVCKVWSGSGWMGLTDITGVAVDCGFGNTVGGTVSGLRGSGLTLVICRVGHGPGYSGVSCQGHGEAQISANGTFTVGAAYPAGYSGADFLRISQQPASPPQHCTITNNQVNTLLATNTGATVTCADYLEYSYVVNAADNSLSGYSIDATTGVHATIGTTNLTGASPHAIVAGGSYDARFVFVANEDSNDVSAFAVDSATGELTPAPGSPYPAGSKPAAMLWSAQGGLYVANAGSDSVTNYFFDPNSGGVWNLQPLTTNATGKGPASMVFGPTNGGVLFVANHGGSNDISVFDFMLDPMPGSPFPAGGNPLSLALGAGGKFLYSANPDVTNPTISGFSVDPNDGALTPLAGSPFPLPVSNYIASDQTGTYLYVTSGTNVVGYRIDAMTGALAALAGFPVKTGADAYSITVDPTNQFLYVANDDAAHVSAYELDASSGALTPIAGSPLPAGSHPQYIATF
jgi:6-phosphogluconolactonase